MWIYWQLCVSVSVCNTNHCHRCIVLWRQKYSFDFLGIILLDCFTPNFAIKSQSNSTLRDLPFTIFTMHPKQFLLHTNTYQPHSINTNIWIWSCVYTTAWMAQAQMHYSQLCWNLMLKIKLRPPFYRSLRTILCHSECVKSMGVWGQKKQIRRRRWQKIGLVLFLLHFFPPKSVDCSIYYWFFYCVI